MDEDVEQAYSVPTHLKASGSFGIIPARVAWLGFAALVLGAGPGIVLFSLDQPTWEWVTAFVVPFIVLIPFAAWWQDPPPEHGFVQWIAWQFKRKRLGPQHLRLVRDVRIADGVVYLGSGTECRALLALPTVNLEHASLGNRRRHHRQYGGFLDGLTAQRLQIVVRGIPLPRSGALARMRKHRNPIAKRVAAWLEGHYEQKEAIARPRLLVVPAPDLETLNDRVDSVKRSLRQINLDPEHITDDDELRDIVNDWWTWRPHPIRMGPELVVRHPDHMEIDGEWIQVYALGKTPPTIVTDWLRSIVDGDLAADVVLNLNQQSLWWAKMRLDMRINDLSTSVLSPGRKIALEQAIALRAAYENKTRPWDAEILMVVRGHDQATMQKRARRLKQQHKDMGASLRLMRWEQLEALEHAQPLCIDEWLPYRAFPTETGTLARTTPFSASTLQVDGGVPFGFTGSSPTLFTLRQPRRVLHMGWYGVPGSGKGFSVRVLLGRRHFAEDLRLFLWDNDASHHEYSGRFTEFLGGYTFSPRSIAELRDFEISARLNVVAFDVTGLDNVDIGEAFAVFVAKVEAHMLEYPGPAACVVDEATDIAEHPDQRGAQALTRGVTHHRKMSIEWHVITQRVSDWMSTATGRKVQGSLGAKWYGQLESTELAEVAHKIGVSPEERARIEAAGVGQGLLVGYGRRAWVDLYDHASPEEYEMAHTDPAETVAIITAARSVA